MIPAVAVFTPRLWDCSSNQSIWVLGSQFYHVLSFDTVSFGLLYSTKGAIFIILEIPYTLKSILFILTHALFSDALVQL